jgi:methylmalonyl-CoA/ethylmalonyl-CoA epimerase
MIQRFTHVGIAVHDLDAAIDHWCDLYGLQVRHRIDVEVEGLRTALLGPIGDHLAFGVELIAPMDPADESNQVVQHLARRGEGLFHLAATVVEVQAIAAHLADAGARVIEAPPAEVGAGLVDAVDPSASRVIVHPKSSTGVLVELLQQRR